MGLLNKRCQPVTNCDGQALLAILAANPGINIGTFTFTPAPGVDLGDFTINNTGYAQAIPSQGITVAGNPTAYRSAIAAPDVAAPTGLAVPTCTLLNGVGSATAGVYYLGIVGVNQHGRTVFKAGNATVTLAAANLAANMAFAAVTGITAWDIYFQRSTGATNPKNVARITEAQRLAGCKITGIDTVTSVGASSAANSVDIYVEGTGPTPDVTAAQNTAYIVPANPIVATGFQYVDFDLACVRTSGLVSPALIIVPFFWDSLAATYFAGEPRVMSFGGASGLWGSVLQVYRLEARGRTVALGIASISAGMNVTLTYVLS